MLLDFGILIVFCSFYSFVCKKGETERLLIKMYLTKLDQSQFAENASKDLLKVFRLLYFLH